MFRIFWFILGLAIGSWLLRPQQREDSSASASNATPNGRAEIKTLKRQTQTAPRAAARLRSEKDTAKTKEIPVVVDNLLDIKGIGPTFVNRLNDLGITSFAQLAQENPQDLAEKMGGRITAERITREDWIGQAKTLMSSNE